MNNGTSWTAVDSGLSNAAIFCLAANGTNLFAGTSYQGVFLSTNNGTSWTAANTGLTNLDINSFAGSGTNLFAGTGVSGVFLTRNNGTYWTAVNSGLSQVYISALGVFGANLFAGTSKGVWRRALSEMITGVTTIATDLPADFNLKQNYPNPFNPSTTIQYALPHRSQVMLRVYNTLGQQVAALVNDNQDAGIHDVKFDGSGLASGVYFYRLSTEAYVAAKKMLLLK